MNSIDNKKQKIGFFILIIIILCFLYLGARVTYTFYESSISGKLKADTAGIAVTINGENVIGNETLDNQLILDNITWTSSHTRQGKMSPGSSGTIDLELDPAGSEVAILYEFQFLDKMIDNDKLLTFDNISCDDTSFVRTAVDTYSGIITLADLDNSKIVHLSVDFSFDSLEDIPGITEDNQVFTDFFEINFHAVQYRGEVLVPYSG